MNETTNTETGNAAGGRMQALVIRDRREHMKKAVASLQEYMATYDKQFGYEDYTTETFVDDVLYGLGIALDPQHHQCAQGFEIFKQKLLRHLGV